MVNGLLRGQARLVAGSWAGRTGTDKPMPMPGMVEYYLVVIFDSKEAYTRNADSPEQDAAYRRMLALLEGEPEWHDGEIVYTTPQSA